MHATYKNALMWTLYGVLFLLIAVLQTVVFGRARFFGVKLTLIPVCIACVSMLAGAEAALRDSMAIYADAVDQGALCNLRMELARFLQGESGHGQRLFAQAITPQGVLQFADSLLREQTICLDLPFGFDTDCLIYPLAVGLYARGVGYRAAMHPLEGKRMAHLCTDHCAVVGFVAEGYPVRTLPFDQALLNRHRSALDFNRAAHDLLLRQAADSLQEAKARHDQLERLYGDAVHSDARQALCEQAMKYLE